MTRLPICCEVVLSAESSAGDECIFSNVDAVGEDEVDPVFKSAESVAVGFQEGDCFQNWEKLKSWNGAADVVAECRT